MQRARDGIDQASSRITSGALAASATAGTVATGAVLALFATLFFLSDGPRIWEFLLRLLPREARGPVDVAAVRAWHSVGAYVRVIPLVALVQATFIGIGAAILGVPFAPAIAVLTFFAAFVPYVGAIIAGSAASLVAFVAVGPVRALIMIGIVLAVHQLEGNVLHPLLVGRALRLHPPAVVLATAIGLLFAGLVGGVLAVPIMAGFAVGTSSFISRSKDIPATPE